MSLKVHGAPERFEAVSSYISTKHGKEVRYIADVAGGQGKLTRLLNKKYNYESEVIDPRGWVLRGVPNREEEFNPENASFYDLIVGLHPDEATRSVAEAALIRPAILIPCCNFWSQSEKLGRDALINSISKYYDENDVTYEIVTFDFKSSRNIGIVSSPKRGY